MEDHNDALSAESRNTPARVARRDDLEAKLRRWTQRTIRALAVLAVLAWLWWWLVPLALVSLGQTKHADPAGFAQGASPAARALVERSLNGLDLSKRVDGHAHVAGLQGDWSGASVHPEMLSWRHPIKHAQFLAYTGAAGVQDLTVASQQWMKRLDDMVTAAGAGRCAILAFDKHYRADGTVDEARTEFYVPDDFVVEYARFHAEFVPVASVHPYAPDALQRLDRMARFGVRLIKWLPNAQGMDPADERVRPYYERMKEHGMALLSHTGHERAVEADELQELGNPLRLRLPLSMGVRVIAGHCGSVGTCLDLDDPARGPKPAFDLWLRLMEDPRWEGLLYGELSALPQYDRSQTFLTILSKPELHARLLDGSDWPLPAFSILWDLDKLVELGLLLPADANALAEIREWNPWLMDLCLKRALRHPETGASFPASVFEWPEWLLVK
jgi:predicted TIM-barrel fold metal-dependent hydrolase